MEKTKKLDNYYHTSATHSHTFGDGVGTYDTVDIEVSSGTSPA